MVVPVIEDLLCAGYSVQTFTYFPHFILTTVYRDWCRYFTNEETETQISELLMVTKLMRGGVRFLSQVSLALKPLFLSLLPTGSRGCSEDSE